jgi:hypothetical protein
MSYPRNTRMKYPEIRKVLIESKDWEEALSTLRAKYGNRVNEDSIRGKIRRATPEDPNSLINAAKSRSPFRIDLADDPSDVATTAIPEDYLSQNMSERRIKHLRNENKKLMEHLHEANARANLVSDIQNGRTLDIKIKEPKSRLREGTAVILASDWHVEETVDPDTISGRNAYNMEIAQKRSQKFFSGIRWMIDYRRTAFVIRDVILWLGGDLISGYIHPELAEANEASPIEAILFVKSLISNGIAYLLKDPKIENLYIPCSYGNHGRTTEKIRIQTGAENSFEWLLYNVLKDEWKEEKRVHFVVDRSAHQYIDVYGKTLHFHHGDDLRFGGGVGGISIAINKRIPVWDRFRPAEVHNIGHWHQWMPLRRCVVNGSLIGYSPYSLRIGADYEDPVQAFYIFDSKRGKVEQTQIWVTDDNH